MLSDISVLTQDCSISPLLQVWGLYLWRIIYTSVLCAHFVRVGHTKPLCQGSPRASCLVWVRKVEVKTSNFGSSTVLVWLCPYREVAAPLALPHCHPQNQGRRRTVSCTQLSLWHAGFLFWKQKQTLVSADVDSIATEVHRFCHLKCWQKLSSRIMELIRLKKIFEITESNH